MLERKDERKISFLAPSRDFAHDKKKDDEDERQKEIRNLVSLDYWFVSGIYAETLHVEKCFLM